MSLAWRALLVFCIFARIQCQEEGEEEPMGEMPDPEEGEMSDQEDSPMEPLSVTRMQGLHAKADTNGDGKVSHQEIMTLFDSVSKAQAIRGSKDIMEYTDQDKDGFLTLEEHIRDITDPEEEQQGQNEQQEEHKAGETAKFKAADANGDGKLSGDELVGLFYPEQSEAVHAASVAETMRRKDKNKDGKLTVQELEEDYMSDMGDEASEEAKQQMADYKADSLADFKRADSNGDGSLDAKEVGLFETSRFHTEGTMKKLFELADKNSDGHISSDELVAARELIANNGAHHAAHHQLMEWAEHHEL